MQLGLFYASLNVGWSPNGGLSLGLSGGVGIEGWLYAGVGVNYGFKSNNWTFTGNLGAFGGYLYGGYDTKAGWMGGVGVAAPSPFAIWSPISINSNLWSAGISYSENGGWSANAAGWSYSRGGWMFDPSIGVGYTFEIYGKPIAITAQEIKSKSDLYPCKDELEAQRAKFFYDRELAYEYMWEKSFAENGTPKVELSAWELETGILVLPYSRNQVDKSLNDAFKTTKWGRTGGRAVIVNGDKYKIISHSHTHPSSVSEGSHPIGLSKNDLNFQRWLQSPIKILYNRSVYLVDGTFNYKTNNWNYEYLGKW